MTGRAASRYVRAAAFVATAVVAATTCAPAALAKTAKPHPRKPHRFVRHGVSYTPYVPPATGATQGTQNFGSSTQSVLSATCTGPLRADRWPTARRLTIWEAFERRGDAASSLVGERCAGVAAFVERLALTPAANGRHVLGRGWTCVFGSPTNRCTHRAGNGAPDLGIVFRPPGALSAERHFGLMVPAGRDTPTAEGSEYLSIYATPFTGTRRFLVVGSGPCGPSAAATQAAMLASDGLVFADDRLAAGEVYLRPTWPGTYHACLFWQYTGTDRQALAVAQTTFTWSLAGA